MKILTISEYIKINENLNSDEKRIQEIEDPVLRYNFEEAYKNMLLQKNDTGYTYGLYSFGNLDVLNPNENVKFPDVLYKFSSPEIFDFDRLFFSHPYYTGYESNDGYTPFISLTRNNNFHKTFIPGISPEYKVCRIDLKTEELLKDEKYILLNYVYRGNKDRSFYLKEEEVRIYLKYKYWKGKYKESEIKEFGIPFTSKAIDSVTIYKKLLEKYHPWIDLLEIQEKIEKLGIPVNIN